MTNGEKYKTAKERQMAFKQFCKSHVCAGCPFYDSRAMHGCIFNWLEMEAEEELLPCPFCGGKARVLSSIGSECFGVQCNNGKCKVSPITDFTADINDAIASWNRRAK